MIHAIIVVAAVLFIFDKLRPIVVPLLNILFYATLLAILAFSTR